MKKTREKNCFTLIELLVVIAIIAILAGMLLPALNNARKSAHSSKCIGNIKEIARIYNFYSDDNDGHLPNPWTIRYGGNTSNKYFLEKLAKIYGVPFGIKVENGLFRCPEYPSKGYTGGLFATSYGANIMGFIGQESPADSAVLKYKKISSFPAASKTCMTADNYNHWRVDWNGDAASITSQDIYTKSTLAFRHNGRASIAFIDGHAESRLPIKVPCLQGYPNMTSAANLKILYNSFFWNHVNPPTAYNGM